MSPLFNSSREIMVLNTQPLKNAYRALVQGISSLPQEGRDTGEMLRVFFRQLSAKLSYTEHPSEKEVREAIEQLKDVNRFAFMLTVTILPGSVMMIPLLHKLGKKYGIELFPSAFRGEGIGAADSGNVESRNR